MKHTINFIDLFDMEKESDKDYIFLLEREYYTKTDYEQWEQEQNRKPAVVTILTPIKNEVSSNTLPF